MGKKENQVSSDAKEQGDAIRAQPVEWRKDNFTQDSKQSLQDKSWVETKEKYGLLGAQCPRQKE